MYIRGRGVFKPKMAISESWSHIKVKKCRAFGENGGKGENDVHLFTLERCSVPPPPAETNVVPARPPAVAP